MVAKIAVPIQGFKFLDCQYIYRWLNNGGKHYHNIEKLILTGGARFLLRNMVFEGD